MVTIGGTTMCIRMLSRAGLIKTTTELRETAATYVEESTERCVLVLLCIDLNIIIVVGANGVNHWDVIFKRDVVLVLDFICARMVVPMVAVSRMDRSMDSKSGH